MVVIELLPFPSPLPLLLGNEHLEMDPRRSIGKRSTTSIAESTKPTGPDTGLDAATFASSDGAGPACFCSSIF